MVNDNTPSVDGVALGGGTEVIEPNEVVTLSTGVKLRVKQPSTWAVTEVIRRMEAQRPQPPMISNPDRGRDEPNEGDPDYQRALVAFNDRVLERKYDVVIATGTAIVFIPRGVPYPNDDSWLEVMTAIGVPQPDDMTVTERYMRWVKYIAAPAMIDWIMLVTGLRPKAGTPEEDVAAAAITFRGDEERGADTER